MTSVNGNISQIVQKFDEWSGGENNYNKAMNGEQVEDFKMFDFNSSTYANDLQNFAQEYINAYDSDGDSNMSFSEFVSMSSNGFENADLLQSANEVFEFNKGVYQDSVIPQFDKDGDGELGLNEFSTALGYDLSSLDAETKGAVKDLFNSMNTELNPENKNQTLNAGELLVCLNTDIQGIDTATLKYQSDLYNMYTEAFNDFDMDNNKESINAGEFATMLYSSDLDWSKFANTGDFTTAVDGQLDYLDYQTLPMITKGMDGYEALHQTKQKFYNEFYS